MTLIVSFSKKSNSIEQQAQSNESFIFLLSFFISLMNRMQFSNKNKVPKMAPS